MNVLEEIQLGFDEAKQRVYTSMRKVYPSIDTSKSGLVNAIISGFTYLYSSYQVFVRVIQGEVYVSTAQELESLYKLVPMVGITVDQPVPMTIIASAQFQDPSISAAPFYLGGENGFLDDSSNPFLLDTKLYKKLVIYRFDDVNTYNWDSGVTYANMSRPEVYDVIANDGRLLYLAVKKLIGAEYVPISLFDGDALVLEVPYIKGTALLTATVVYDRALITSVDADVDTASCSLDNLTGLIKVALVAGCTFLNKDDEHDSLIGQPINATYTIRSHVKSALDVNQAAASGLVGAGIYGSDFVQKFTSKYIDLTEASGLGAGDIGREDGVELYSEIVIREDLTVFGVPAGDRFGVLHATDTLDKDSLIIEHSTITALKFDFSKAVILTDDRWGEVPTVTVSYSRDIDGSGIEVETDIKAYLLDASIGLVIFEYGWQWDTGLAALKLNAVTDYLVSYATDYNSKEVLRQVEEKIETVLPEAINETTLDYTLETAEDLILFQELAIDAKNSSGIIIDPEFVQVADVSLFENTATINYFEVQPLLPTKVRVRFKNDDLLAVFNGTISSLDILYKTVKDLENYQSGTVISGSAQLFKEDGSGPEILFGATEFNFSGVNLLSKTGTGGVPTLEIMRDILERAAYTYDKNVSVTNYEAAIGTYFLNGGFDSLVRVFDYEDFGTVFLNSTKGNFVFYIGVVNRYMNSDLILVVDTSMNAAWYGSDDSAELSVAELEALLFSGFTHISRLPNALVNVVTNGEAEDVRVSIKDDSVMTNYQMSQDSWILSWAVYFAYKLRPSAGYTYTQAKAATIKVLSSLFTWSKTQFTRDINVSDVYNLLDSLPEVSKLILTNMSHYKNTDPNDYKVADITYRTLTANVDVTDEVLGGGQGTASLVYELQTNYYALLIPTNPALFWQMLKIRVQLVVTKLAISYDCLMYLIPDSTPYDRDGDGVEESYKLFLSLNGTSIDATTIANDNFVGWVKPGTGEIELLLADATQKGEWTTALRDIETVPVRILGSTGGYLPESTISMIVFGIVDNSSIFGNYTFDLTSIRNENPLLNFSGVVDPDNLSLEVDILALGGINVEPY